MKEFVSMTTLIVTTWSYLAQGPQNVMDIKSVNQNVVDIKSVFMWDPSFHISPPFWNTFSPCLLLQPALECCQIPGPAVMTP